MQTDTETMAALLAGTYYREQGREIARREILAGLKRPSPAVAGLMREFSPDFAAGYLDTWRAVMGA